MEYTGEGGAESDCGVYLGCKMKKAAVAQIMRYDNQTIYEKMENIVDNMGKFKREKVNSKVIIVD